VSAPAPPSAGLLSLRGIDKSFGSARVLREVDLDLAPGEVVGLMGANGAGKSTLIKILAGVHAADAGRIELMGEEVDDLAGRPEVGIIHQDLGLVDTQSVLDNMRLGARPLALLGPLLNRRAEIDAVGVALARVGLEDRSVFELVGTLTPGEKALLAIARLLERGARIILVDETTASLPPAEAAWFIDKLREAAACGTAVVMVSHKLAEIRLAADRLVLLTDGRVTADAPMSDFADREDDLVRLLLGEEVEELAEGAEARPSGRGEVVLELDGVCRGVVGPVDLEVARGEVVGLTGRVGSGLHEIALIAAGFLAPESGTVGVRRGVRRAIVPPQREIDGVFAELPAKWNMTLPALPRWRSSLRLLRLGSERGAAEAMMQRLRIVPDDLGMPIGQFSGGNQQKVLFARTMLQEPDLFVLCEPTRGVDLRTRREIYRLVQEFKGQGCGVLVATSDVEDVIAVCDRAGAVEDGAVTRVWAAEDLTPEVLAEIL